MGIRKLHINAFLEMSATAPVLDVRSPGEYAHAHIPGAFSLPLFSDEERKVVGTAYKQESREKAIKIGLKYFGKKMVKMVEATETIIKTHYPHHRVLLHCWRGGMRSAGVAWLLDLYGFEVYTLEGGYKAYRNWVLQQFAESYNILVIGGYTGSAKTGVLQALRAKGEAVIDMEALANHKGSAFGNIGMPPQPGQEMFENLLATALYGARSAKRIWMEDESQRIGDVNIPFQFYRFLRKQPVYFLNVPFEERLEQIVQEYGGLDKERLVNSIIRIQRRLGGLETKNAVNFLIEGNTKESFRILLRYYDRWYDKSLQMGDDPPRMITTIDCPSCNTAANAGTLQQIASHQLQKTDG